MPMRAPGTNLEIIFADWLDAMRQGDIKRLAARLAPEVIHQGVRAEWICMGREAVLDNVGNRAKRLPEVQALELIACGDQVVLAVRGPDVGPPDDGTDRLPRGQAFIVFTLRDGRIVRMQDYYSRAEAVAGAGATHVPDWL
jgi:ketosteroid isomerase-like protein